RQRVLCRHVVSADRRGPLAGRDQQPTQERRNLPELADHQRGSGATGLSGPPRPADRSAKPHPVRKPPARRTHPLQRGQEPRRRAVSGPRPTPGDADVIATKLLNSFSAPFQAGEHEFFISTSIGTALFPTDGADVATLIKNADAAMYRSKAKGRNRVENYTRDLTAQA
nr:hypothetical protein [Tanacetum cinerariifolium]